MLLQATYFSTINPQFVGLPIHILRPPPTTSSPPNLDPQSPDEKPGSPGICPCMLLTIRAVKKLSFYDSLNYCTPVQTIISKNAKKG